MSLAALFRWLLGWAVVTAAFAIGACAHFSLRRDGVAKGPTICSVFREGRLLHRSLRPLTESDPARDAAIASGGTVVVEEVIDEGPILTVDPLIRALSFVPYRDGVAVTIDGRTERITPEQIMAAQLWDRALPLAGLDVGIGLDVDQVLAIAAERLALPFDRVRDHAKLTRFSVRRTTPQVPPQARPNPAVIDAATLRASALAGARYLARQVKPDGHLRYEIDPITDADLPGYTWPRHAGATLFLAQVAGRTGDPEIVAATKRAAALMRGGALGTCGAHVCVGEGALADLGASAIAVIAFTELVESGVDPASKDAIPRLTEFLRSMQKPDGEMVHYYDRRANAPLEWHSPFYTGEAALALARAHRVTGDMRDLEAAKHALDALVATTFKFFGDRYWWAEEHWTCQAMADLWTRAPNPTALSFCLHWMEYNRSIQYRDGETLFDGDGGYGMGTFIVPRYTAVGSRNEAGSATLRAAIAAGVPIGERQKLDAQLRRGFAMLLRGQFTPGLSHLFRRPANVAGAWPASPVDLHVRIDYPQHAGGGMLSYADMLDGVPLR